MPSVFVVTPSSFAVFDADKNGKLSRHELKDILTRMTRHDGTTITFDEGEADEIIDRFMRDNDGEELTLGEYVEAMRTFVPIK